ncbi:hypothetical protein BC830DRAFT_1102385 [Chytriomyces sp. MP71]|nr:hypothetical protein BC830DRAFT_1102385 [Chytriomyces sp. MP71]
MQRGEVDAPIKGPLPSRPPRFASKPPPCLQIATCEWLPRRHSHPPNYGEGVS